MDDGPGQPSKRNAPSCTATSPLLQGPKKLGQKSDDNSRAHRGDKNEALQWCSTHKEAILVAWPSVDAHRGNCVERAQKQGSPNGKVDEPSATPQTLSRPIRRLTTVGRLHSWRPLMWLRPYREPITFCPATFHWLKTARQRAEDASATFQQRVGQMWKVRIDGRILFCAHTVNARPLSDWRSSSAGKDAPF